MQKIHLLIIDPQNDFCDPDGALYVKGAEQDMQRLADFIDTYRQHLSGITITFDVHKSFHIASPVFWIDSKTGTHPEFFTIIKKQDVLSVRYYAAVPAYQKLAEYYVWELENNGRYELCIWPPHCIIGSNGANIYKPLFDAIERYNSEKYNATEYIYKSTNSFTEQYSVLRADVSMGEKDNIYASSSIAHTVAANDMILVAGEALSHCVANSLLDIAKYISKDFKKFVLLEDAVSSVDGFEYLSEIFLDRAFDLGIRVMKTTDMRVFFND